MKFLLILVFATGAVLLLLSKRTHEDAAPSAMRNPSGALGAWKEAIDANALPALKVRLTGKRASGITASKVGGDPYWPADKTYPTSADGTPLHLLAQINFAEIETPLQDYPSSGLLQFFIAADDLYGLDFTKPGDDPTKNRGHAVVFHAEASDALHSGTASVQRTEDDMLPFYGESAIVFEAASSRVSPLDYRFDRILPGISERYDETEPLYDYAIEAPSHQMGGYAVFTQTDPRAESAKDEDWHVLLQLDSEEKGKLEMIWGDVGIANFFIRPDDLKRGDFSRVWYNWDCH